MTTYTPQDLKHEMRQNLQFLREFARRAMVEGDTSLSALEDVKEAIVDEVWKAGAALGLTERDLVVLLYKGVLPQCY